MNAFDLKSLRPGMRVRVDAREKVDDSPKWVEATFLGWEGFRLDSDANLAFVSVEKAIEHVTALMRTTDPGTYMVFGQDVRYL